MVFSNKEILNIFSLGWQSATPHAARFCVILFSANFTFICDALLLLCGRERFGTGVSSYLSFCRVYNNKQLAARTHSKADYHQKSWWECHVWDGNGAIYSCARSVYLKLLYRVCSFHPCVWCLKHTHTLRAHINSLLPGINAHTHITQACIYLIPSLAALRYKRNDAALNLPAVKD